MTQADHVLTVVFVGHVDHGKSTLVGRLLADAGALPEGKLAFVQALCRRTAKPFEYAFLVDALKDEMSQGITLDVARLFFRAPTRPVMILDAPGHVEFLKNMVTGAARAEAAFLVIDAREGVRENSRRHAYLLALLGVRQVVVLINKMDLVGYDAARFAEVEAEIRAFLASIDVEPLACLPVSGLAGDNLVRPSPNLPWYEGPALLDLFARFRSSEPEETAPLRLPVQDVYKFTEDGDTRRLIVGTLTSGRLRAGDEVVFLPSGKRGRVATLERFPAMTDDAFHAGEAAAFTLTEQLYLTRGELMAKVNEPAPWVATRLMTSVFWMGKRPLDATRDVWLKLGTAKVQARITRLEQVLDASSLAPLEANAVPRHAAARVEWRLAKPLAGDRASLLPDLGRFVIVEDDDIRGGGLVLDALGDAEPAVTATRVPRGFTLWFTGLSGAGKSTLAREITPRLAALGLEVEWLDGDEVRPRLSAGAGFSKTDRDTHIRRLGYVCELLNRHGVVTVVSAISPYAAVREENRRTLGRYLEVYCRCSLTELQRRDVKGLYKKARDGKLPGLTGVSDPYEPPEAPDVEIDSGRQSIEASLDAVWSALRARGYLPD